MDAIGKLGEFRKKALEEYLNKIRKHMESLSDAELVEILSIERDSYALDELGKRKPELYEAMKKNRVLDGFVCAYPFAKEEIHAHS